MTINTINNKLKGTKMKLFEYLNRMALMEDTERVEFLGHLEMRNLGSAELTENDMWILTTASGNNDYLQSKLAEEELAAETEAPEEAPAVEAPVDTAVTDTVTAEETPTEEVPSTEETPTEPEAEEPTAEETPTEEDSEDAEIETSKEGVGVLAMLGEIQEKLATGKPSAVEVAAIKALKKLVS